MLGLMQEWPLLCHKVIDHAAAPRAQLGGVLNVRGRRVVGRVGGGAAAGFCRGFEVTVHFDEERFSGSGVYLFSAVLERFFRKYVTINSFTETVLTTQQRGEIARWRPHSGLGRMI